MSDFQNQLTEDLDNIFFNLEEFSEEIIYTTNSIAYQIPAFIDFQSDLEFEGAKASASLVVLLRKSDIAKPKYLDKIEYNSQSWTVRKIENGGGNTWNIKARSDGRTRVS